MPVRYTGVGPGSVRAGPRGDGQRHRQGGTFVGQENSLTTKCPSKYQAVSGAIENTAGKPLGPAVVSS